MINYGLQLSFDVCKFDRVLRDSNAESVKLTQLLRLNICREKGFLNTLSLRPLVARVG